MRKEFLLLLVALLLSGCANWPFDYPRAEIRIQTLKQEDAALRVLVENKSSFYIKITYPVQTEMLEPNQYTIFSLPRAGNYNVVVTGYEESKDYKYDYKKIRTIELPIYLNGLDILKTRAELVGYSLTITDGMFKL